jgi:hypothetical protein
MVSTIEACLDGVEEEFPQDLRELRRDEVLV